MAGIRINTGVKRIEVNDEGDFITLSLNDKDFISRFFALYENVQKLADESSTKEATIQQKYIAGGDKDGFLKEAFQLYADSAEKMKEEVDLLFGDGTCKKVFGGIEPTFDLYLDFFEQLTPYLQEFAKEKAQRMSKYSAARTGNV